MLDNDVSLSELNSSSYQSMLTVPDAFLTQTGIQETYQKVEKDLQEFLKRKGININNDNSQERERERERANSVSTSTITFRNHAIRN